MHELLRDKRMQWRQHPLLVMEDEKGAIAVEWRLCVCTRPLAAVVVGGALMQRQQLLLTMGVVEEEPAVEVVLLKEPAVEAVLRMMPTVVMEPPPGVVRVRVVLLLLRWTQAAQRRPCGTIVALQLRRRMRIVVDGIGGRLDTLLPVPMMMRQSILELMLQLLMMRQRTTKMLIAKSARRQCVLLSTGLERELQPSSLGPALLVIVEVTPTAMWRMMTVALVMACTRGCLRRWALIRRNRWRLRRHRRATSPSDWSGRTSYCVLPYAHVAGCLTVDNVGSRHAVLIELRLFVVHLVHLLRVSTI